MVVLLVYAVACRHNLAYMRKHKLLDCFDCNTHLNRVIFVIQTLVVR